MDISLILNFLNNIWIRTLEIATEPLKVKSMLWILIPLLSTLFMMELYFGRYKKEQLGWNSAVSNSIVLFFVSFNLLGWLYQNNMLIFITKPTNIEIATAKSFIAIIILFESFLLMVLNFFHAFRGKFAFELSSPLIMNYIGVISIIIIYSNIPLDYVTLISVIFIFILFALFFWILKFMVPTAPSKDKPIKRVAQKIDYGRY